MNASEYSKYSVGIRKWPGKQYTSKLLIRNTKSTDSGIYRCRVNAGRSPALERQFKVNVQESVLTTTRLESYTQEGEGLVEVLQQNKWNRFDFRGFSTIEVSLVCRSLRYPYGGVPRNRLIDDKPVFEFFVTSRRNRHRMCIFGLRCSPNATDISQCFCPDPKTDCMFLVGVTCRLQPIEIPDVPVRLTVKIPGMDLKNLREGVVEVFFNGHWGFVCFNGINGTLEVNALCHTLGFRFGGMSYRKQYIYLLDSSLDMTREYLQNISCPENAMHFDDCKHTDWGERCEASSCGCDLGIYMALATQCWTDTEIRKGVTYIRWGRKSCPAGADMIYTGQVGGNQYSNKGGGVNYLCLPNDPENGQHQSYANGQVYGGEYELGSSYKPSGWDESMNNKEVPCSVCYKIRSSAVLTIPGRKTCYKGWNLEYHGYLMSDHYTHRRRDYACVDINAEPLDNNNGSEDGALFYSIRTKCGSLKCPPYTNSADVLCVVCTK